MRFFESAERLLESVDAVVVCSENRRHAGGVIPALRAGVDVLCEKPISTTVEDAHEMIRAAEETGQRFGIAFPVRHAPAVRRAREIVRSGAIGRVLAVNGTNHGQPPGGWVLDPEMSGGGAVMDHTVHVADLLRWIFAREIVSVYAEIDTRIHPGLPVDDIGMLLLDLEGGLPASLDASWSRPKSWPIWGGLTMDVIGDRGVISMNAFNQNLQLFDDRRGSYTLQAWSEGGDPGLVRSFIDAIRNDTTPAVTGEDGLHAVEVALCAYESARRREPVACPAILG